MNATDIEESLETYDGFDAVGNLTTHTHPKRQPIFEWKNSVKMGRSIGGTVFYCDHEPNPDGSDTVAVEMSGTAFRSYLAMVFYLYFGDISDPANIEQKYPILVSQPGSKFSFFISSNQIITNRKVHELFETAEAGIQAIIDYRQERGLNKLEALSDMLRELDHWHNRTSREMIRSSVISLKEKLQEETGQREERRRTAWGRLLIRLDDLLSDFTNLTSANKYHHIVKLLSLLDGRESVPEAEAIKKFFGRPNAEKLREMMQSEMEERRQMLKAVENKEGKVPPWWAKLEDSVRESSPSKRAKTGQKSRQKQGVGDGDNMKKEE